MGLFDKYKKPETTTVSPATPEPQSGGGILDLKKKAGISLSKHNLSGTRAAVYLVLDYSGSMNRYYKDHTVQDFTEKVLALGVNLDDDGQVPVTLFDNRAREPFVVDVQNYQGAVDAAVSQAGHMGTTNYADAMRSIIKQHTASGASEPALVVFQTDGSPDSRREAEQVLCEASSLPIFWQFVGFGSDRFEFLKKLDELPVPKKRVVDNAGFFEAGRDPKSLSPEALYDQLLGEFPQWLQAARAQGIVR